MPVKGTYSDTSERCALLCGRILGHPIRRHSQQCGTGTVDAVRLTTVLTTSASTVLIALDLELSHSARPPF
jgi:hypothetical protein